MATASRPEVWLRGPVPSVPVILQPVAHALLQAREEVNELVKHFPDALLWEKPGGAASAGFHLQHLTGVLDRLFTYAHGQGLSEEQLRALKQEGDREATKEGVEDMVQAFNQQVDRALHDLAHFNEQMVVEKRAVGRAQLPSTVLGLLFHAAEHTMRHLGQLLVTVKVLTNTANDS